MPKSQEVGEKEEVLSRSKQVLGLNTWSYEQCGTNPQGICLGGSSLGTRRGHEFATKLVFRQKHNFPDIVLRESKGASYKADPTAVGYSVR